MNLPNLTLPHTGDEDDDIERENSISESLHDPARLCPIIAGVAQIKGKRLKIQLGAKVLTLSAPTAYLAKLNLWCQGRLSLAEIDKLGERTFKSKTFSQFIRAMLDAGILVDAAGITAHIARHADTLGIAVEKEVWKKIRAPLPQPEAYSTTYSLLPPDKTPLLKLLASRKSANSFGRGAFSSEALTHLLFAAYASQTAAGGRPVASAGGFYRVMFHLVLLKSVGDLAPGLYSVHYDANGGTHLQHQSSSIEDIHRFFFEPSQLRDAAGVLVLSADLSVASLKYKNRAYSYALLEAGSVIQNIALSAAEQDFGWRPIGGVDEGLLSAYCQLPSQSNLLITGLFGCRQSPQLRTVHEASPVPMRVEFSWSNSAQELPFHMGMARIDSDDPQAQIPPFSWGRDQNAELAYDKAVAEATERHAYHQLNDAICISARACDLPHYLPPTELTGFHAAQYRRASFPFSRFDPRSTYLWTKAQSLFSEESIWVPAACVFSRDALRPYQDSRPLTHATSSGCASGLSIQHARQAALFELIERDAFMRHWFAQQGAVDIAPDSLPAHLHPRIDRLLSKKCSVSIQLLDLGVSPVWMCFIQHQEKHFTAVGTGAGLDAHQALESALTEAETATYVRLQAKTAPKITAKSVIFPHDHADLYATKHYFRHADALLKCAYQLSFSEASARCHGRLEQVYAALKSRGLNPLWIDLTLPSAPQTLAGKKLYSCRMLVPGLIPMTFGNNRMPLAMDHFHHPAARFPHPFP